jgi:hypothetical protein
MDNVWKQAELHATMPTRIGLLRDICRALAAKDVDIRSIEAYDNDSVGEFYLITSDDWAAEKILRELGADVAPTDVVCAELENRPGALLDLATAIADADINIWQMRSISTSDSEKALVVFHVENPVALVAMLRAV